MSSNDIVYTDDESDAESIIFETEEETMFKMNDINPVKKSLDEMEKEELLEIIKKDKANKKRYIRKYQQTEKGKVKTREASKKYYDANRAKILEKKRIAYQKKKADKLSEKKYLN
tara:strand:+ start:29 stop:373 length:345 start_codon:yes stop_codon:yes gene_type:complete